MKYKTKFFDRVSRLTFDKTLNNFNSEKQNESLMIKIHDLTGLVNGRFAIYNRKGFTLCLK